MLPHFKYNKENLSIKPKKDIELIDAHELQKDKILEALTVSKDISEASKIAGVTRKTIYSYLKDEDLIIAYRDIKHTQLREISEKISNGAKTAAKFLIEILDDASAPSNIKLHASTKLLDFYIKFINIETNMNSAIFEEIENSFDVFKLPSGL